MSNKIVFSSLLHICMTPLHCGELSYWVVVSQNVSCCQHWRKCQKWTKMSFGWKQWQ